MKPKHDNEVVLTCDGAGPRQFGASKIVGYAAVLFGPDGTFQKICNEWKIAPMLTNNMAEFYALELALIMCDEYPSIGDKKFIIYSDSQYTVNCFYNPGLVQKPHLKPIQKRWNELAALLNWNVAVRWIEREENTIADKASKEAINFAMSAQ